MRGGPPPPGTRREITTKALKLANALLALTTGMALAGHPTVGGAPMFADKTIVENARSSADHTTLQATGPVETLQDERPFTVLSPTNDAFAKLPVDRVETLLKPENKDKRAKILTCHVVAADAMAADIRKMVADDGGMQMVSTMGGCEFTAMVEKGR